MVKTESASILEVKADKPVRSHLHHQERLDISIGIWTDGKICVCHEGRETLFMGEEISVKTVEEKPHSKITLFHHYVCNHSNSIRQIKLIAMHFLKTVRNDHFAFISPADEAVFHLAGQQMFMVEGLKDRNEKWESTIIPSWFTGFESIWERQDQGVLKYNPMAKGNPKSILSAKMEVPPGKTVRASSWIIAGTNKNELLSLNESLLKNRLAFPDK